MKLRCVKNSWTVHVPTSSTQANLVYGDLPFLIGGVSPCHRACDRQGVGEQSEHQAHGHKIAARCKEIGAGSRVERHAPAGCIDSSERHVAAGHNRRVHRPACEFPWAYAVAKHKLLLNQRPYHEDGEQESDDAVANTWR
jgi:hypothetical protein